ncbi:MAG: hypothetical protein ACYCTE_14670, partial [Acidimicrobiales bacterium]
MGFDPRAAVGEALRNGVGASTGDRPTPKRADGAIRTLTATTDRRPPAPHRSTTTTAAPSAAQQPAKAVGVRRGQRRVLDLNLGRQARAVLAADDSGRTRTDVVLEAIEATYAQIVEAHGRKRTGLFAAAGCPPQRRLVDDPRKVVVTVSEAEAEILS